MKKVVKVFLVVLGILLVGFVALAIWVGKDIKREEEKAESIILGDMAYSETDAGYAGLSRKEKEEKLLGKHVEVAGTVDEVSSLYLIFSEGDLSIKCYMDEIPENIKEGYEVTLHGACTDVGGDYIRLRKCIATSVKEPIEKKQPEEMVEKEMETEKEAKMEKEKVPEKDLDEKETQENAVLTEEQEEEQIVEDMDSSDEKNKEESVSEEGYSYNENLVLDYVINDSSLSPGTRVRDVINNGEFIAMDVSGNEEEGDFIVVFIYEVKTIGVTRSAAWSFHIYDGLVTPKQVSLTKNGINYKWYEDLDYYMADIIRECAPNLWIEETEW